MNIIGIYKITNTITGDFYIGSSKDVKERWAAHKRPSVWKNHPNNPMYQDMQKYGLDKFAFEILEKVEEEKLKEMEQHFIELLKPTYNNYNASGLNVERCKKSKKEYQKSDKYKEYIKSDKRKETQRKAQKKYQKSDKYKEYKKTEKYKEYQKEYQKEYKNQLCYYNGETLTLSALSTRFRRAGIDHPTLEAKKYLLK